MSDLISRQDALDAVNNCGICIQKILDIPSVEPERTAKVKKRFMLVTGGMGDTLPLCECGFIVSDKWTYCPACGCRLIWGDDDE